MSRIAVLFFLAMPPASFHCTDFHFCNITIPAIFTPRDSDYILQWLLLHFPGFSLQEQARLGQTHNFGFQVCWRSRRKSNIIHPSKKNY